MYCCLPHEATGPSRAVGRADARSPPQFGQCADPAIYLRVTHYRWRPFVRNQIPSPLSGLPPATNHRVCSIIKGHKECWHCFAKHSGMVRGKGRIPLNGTKRNDPYLRPTMFPHCIDVAYSRVVYAFHHRSPSTHSAEALQLVDYGNHIVQFLPSIDQFLSRHELASAGQEQYAFQNLIRVPDKADLGRPSRGPERSLRPPYPIESAVRLGR